MPKVKFEDLCTRDYYTHSDGVGYALDYDYTVLHRPDTITATTDTVYKNIKDCMGLLENGTCKEIKKVWIRKTCVKEKESRTFKLRDPHT